MAHFAKIENNIVTQVVTVADEHEQSGQEYLNSIGLEGEWVQTSYNNNIRKVFAGIGFVYNRDLDRFEPPQPYPSWTWSEELYGWIAPVKNAEDGDFNWDEDSQSWISVE